MDNPLKRKIIVPFTMAAATAGIAAIVLADAPAFQGPERLTEYGGIKLAYGLNEVRYVKGNPVAVESMLTPNSLVIFKHKASDELKGSDKIEEFNAWEYCDGSVDGVGCDIFITIFFDAKRLVSSIHCYSTRPSGCPSVFGISNGATENDIYKALGKPSKSVLYDFESEFEPPKADEKRERLPVYKYIQYSDRGVYFRCEKGKVEDIFVAREMADP